MSPLTTHDLLPAGFFALRTPSLSWDTVSNWSDGLEAGNVHALGGDVDAALCRDGEALRARLRELVRRPDVREAISSASPGLGPLMESWLAGDPSSRVQAVEPVLVRYIMRMACRATPFGLFASVSTGTVADRTELSVPPASSQTRQTRLNLDCIYALVDHLSRQPELRRHLRYESNNSVYEAGDRLRYYRVRLKGNVRSYGLCETTTSASARAALAAARCDGGATIATVAVAVATAAHVELSDAERFAEQLVDAQLLRPAILPNITGGDSLARLIHQLRPIEAAAGVVSVLESIACELAHLDAGRCADDPARDAAIEDKLRSVFPEVDTSRLFKVDARKDGTEPRLSQSIVRELGDGIALLTRIQSIGESPLEQFATAFSARYGDGEVPFLEALDEESGIGFDRAGRPGADSSPLIDGLEFNRESRRMSACGPRDVVLLRKLAEALQSGATGVLLSDADVAELSNAGARPLSPGFTVMATVVARTPEEIDHGNYQLIFQGAAGPSCATLLGRFVAEASPLHALVVSALKAEDSHEPDALHAEVAHVPAGVVGTALSRPLLRDYEVSVMGGSGAPHHQQLPLSDLLVAVRHGNIELRSRMHGRRVIPHLSAAHNDDVMSKGLPAYRLLATLATHRVTHGVRWSWGPILETAPFLPRVSRRRLVLSLAQWNIDAKRLGEVDRHVGAQRFSSMQALRQNLALPRLVRFVDGDNGLLVDLENVLSVDSFLTAIRHRATVKLTEVFPAPHELVASGTEGRFFHEVLVPFIRSSATVSKSTRAPTLANGSEISRRTKLPGDNWLFAKLYTGVATLDRLLVETVAPVIAEFRAEHLIEGWFFIRYADPAWHMRLRLRGEPRRLWEEAAPRLYAALAKDRHLFRNLIIDSYDPEVERYGGPAGMRIAEQIFEADSDAATEIIRRYRSDRTARWQLTLLGMDSALDALGFSCEDKLAIVTRARDGQAAKFDAGPTLRHQLGEKYRPLRADVESLLARPKERYATATLALERRSVELSRASAALADLELRAAASLRAELAVSYLHMWANRMLRGSTNSHEVVIYEFLRRAYLARIARAGQQGIALPAV